MSSPLSERPGWTEPGSPGPRVTALEGLAWALLLAVVMASRWVVAPDVLFDWDSANYALGLRDFDVYEHQPHAPGYPVFLALLELARWIPGPESRPFVVVNAALTAGTLVLLGAMARREVGRVGALALAACFAVCPVFWFQGAVSAAYVAEGFGSTLVAASALALARGRLHPALAGALLGLAIGIRPNGVITLAPLGLYGLYLARPAARPGMAWVAGFGAVCSAWFFPLMALSGGVARYREASGALWHWQTQATSILSGDLSYLASNTSHLLLYLGDALNVLVLLAAGLGALLLWRGASSAATLRFFGVWALPGVLLYAAHHLPKSGYVLTLVPSAFLAVALLVPAAARAARSSGRVWGASVLAGLAYLGLNVNAFWTAVPYELLSLEDAPIDIPDGLFIGDYGVVGLQYRTWPQRRVRDLVDAMDPETELGLFLYGAHELHRLETFYHPDHWQLATSAHHGIALDSEGEETFGGFQIELLESSDFDQGWVRTSLVGLDGQTLLVARGEDVLRVELARRPERIVAFAPCPPCDIVATRGLVPGEALEVGAGYVARELFPEPEATGLVTAEHVE